MILCDTNIFIEIYRNNKTIIESVKQIGQQNLAISDVTRAELFFGARNKKELQAIRKGHKLSLPDAIIGATSIYHKIELYTLNVKDFRFLDEVKLFSI